MRDPSELPPSSPDTPPPSPMPPSPMTDDEILASREEEAGLEVGHGPMHEIAQAFRMNAEALHSLQQMQADLARSVQRGDRSELVLQSTRALNETFRNLTSVQRELLGRLRTADGAGGRGGLVPLMLLGLLVVFLGGVYVILDALDRRDADAGLSVAEITSREREAWQSGRTEGARQVEGELRRLQDRVETSSGRAVELQAELDAKLDRLAELDRQRRLAEVERDEFASQVRRAQNMVGAKQALEDEITSLRMRLDLAESSAARTGQELELQRSRNQWLRERLADRRMGISEDDPPWRPGVPAGADPAEATAADGGVGPGDDEARRRLELLKAGRRKLGLPIDDLEDAPEDTTEAPHARSAESQAAGPRDLDLPPAVLAESSVPPPAPAAADDDQDAGGAVRGGDAHGTRPAPVRPPTASSPARSAPATTDPEAVRTRLNGLLAASGGTGWTIRRLGRVGPDGLHGVVMDRHDRTRQVAERVEARHVRVVIDGDRQLVVFDFRGGQRYDRGEPAPLPPRGLPVIVMQDVEPAAWEHALPTPRSGR